MSCSLPQCLGTHGSSTELIDISVSCSALKRAGTSRRSCHTVTTIKKIPNEHALYFEQKKELCRKKYVVLS
jgi:hypothetical protein